MNNIYGSVGFVFLIKNNKKIILLSDQHDTLPKCDNNINIAEWLKKKMYTSKILLEEVPREDNKLIELWQESQHTQELKQLYLNNSIIISGVDIRPFLIPFNLEVLDNTSILDNYYNITIYEYLKEIDNFFTLKNKYILDNLCNYNFHILKDTLLGEHFIIIKNKYKNFLINLNDNKLIYENVRQLIINNKLILFNNLLDDIMEWYICAQIELYIDKPIIIHAGLAHTTKIMKLLKNHYLYNIKHQEGLYDLDKIYFEKRKGCIELSHDIDNQFGGKYII